MHIIAISNQKGGTGKTSSALFIGAGLAGLGKRVLIVDLDPQSSLTQATIGDSAGVSMAEVLGSVQPGNLAITEIIKQYRPKVDIAPSDIALAVSELGLTTRHGRENVLKRALAPCANAYDYCLIDCPPSLGILAVNALTAADSVIAPTLPTALDLRGLKLFLSSIEAVRRDLNPDLKLLGVVICQYQERLKLHQAALAELEKTGLPILGTINRSVMAAVSVGSGEVLESGIIAEQYNEIARKVVKHGR